MRFEAQRCDRPKVQNLDRATRSAHKAKANAAETAVPRLDGGERERHRHGSVRGVATSLKDRQARFGGGSALRDHHAARAVRGGLVDACVLRDVRLQLEVG